MYTARRELGLDMMAASDNGTEPVVSARQVSGTSGRSHGLEMLPRGRPRAGELVVCVMREHGRRRAVQRARQCEVDGGLLPWPR